ncbi:MAG: glycosyltransferase [Sedimentisphaerales bacterium]
MRILWITNIPFGKLSVLAGLKSGDISGSWLNASLDAFVGDKEYEIIVATIGNTNKIKTLVEDNITYCLLPGGSVAQYNYTSPSNGQTWEVIKNTYKPDLIQIWGTEFTHGYLALQVMQGIPSVIYMQGVMSQIARYYLSGMSDKELRSSITLRDIIKCDWIKRAKRNFHRRSLIEAEMIRISGNVIVENEWCSVHCKAIDPSCVLFKSKLNIKDDFFKQQWDISQIEPYTIMSNAAGYPIKGLHILLKAFGLVVPKYPQAKLYIPGENSPFEKSMLETLKLNGYTKFIKTIIQNLGIKNNVQFLGRLNSEEMAEKMAKSNVFVMPSSIENHSSTLIEAMIVGTPCISSYVGGVPEYVEHNRNGLLYRFEEYEVLAAHILKVFSDPKFAAEIASNASSDMRKSRNGVNLKNELTTIYQQILSRYSNKY